jgi:hypothetical protein
MYDGHFNAHISKSTQDAESDFTTVRNQDALEPHALMATEAIYEESGAEFRTIAVLKTI